jgi:hypothetical protein
VRPSVHEYGRADAHQEQKPLLHLDDGLDDSSGGEQLGGADGQARQPRRDGRELIGPVAGQIVVGGHQKSVRGDQRGVRRPGDVLGERRHQPVEPVEFELARGTRHGCDPGPEPRFAEKPARTAAPAPRREFFLHLRGRSGTTHSAGVAPVDIRTISAGVPAPVFSSIN